MSLSILLYEDNEALRESIASMLVLSDGYKVSGSFSNVLQVIDQLKSIQPDIILMDIDMPGMTGIEAVKKIRLQLARGVPVIMLTVFDDNRNVFDAICAGASGYLLKNTYLGEAFRRTRRGFGWRCADVAQYCQDGDRIPCSLQHLTPTISHPGKKMCSRHCRGGIATSSSPQNSTSASTLCGLI
ncbi:MAG: response regulator transcription factor [Bacteroidota bacterium]